MDILQYDFMQRALIIGIIVSLNCSTIGLFLVLRRFSMVGDTISHVALAGVALGMVMGVYPIYTAIIVSILASLGIEKLRKAYAKYSELALSIVLAGGIGIASLLISLDKGNTNGIMGYLFGSIALVTDKDLYTITLLGSIILISIIFLYRGLFSITFDEESARFSGIKVKAINIYFSILVALTITLSMRIVGILLVSSLMTLPVAASLQISKSFKSALIYSNLFGLISVILGLFISFYLDLAPGGSIVIVSLILLITTIVMKRIVSLVRI
ncbi:zinc ABC transporter permease protein AdcB [Gottschalkia acidurici 9a]|uniref:Zinc ABC transporter permease protein AdcB n=1 Tax=Gottschalkia acidurici (strain ATCC 7906 / DSM 604 / BCRC 14475 / CIP 104303 / KCTC 5404 / NCIMB 10678 / 9a) TaxID=1128398 RepID=K0AZ49_GOTA9|nr:metal ABC transporter permease [Gottschalkia acidurici]AFS77965.1 zinc ABC transporter permease protein AdcB [Gottschalkia acidurici 9a]